MTQAGAFTPEDFWRLRFITDLDLSADGAWIAYAVQSSDRETNATCSAIWLLDTSEGTERRLTNGLRSDFAPRFSPDGDQLAFVSTRGADGAQIWVIALAGGEARQVTHLPHGASEPAWSPDGMSLYVKCAVSDDESDSDGGDEPDRPRVYSRLQYRWDGRGYLKGRTQLFRVALATGVATQLTRGDFDCGHPTPSPDGRWLAYIADEADDRDANMSTDVYILDLTTSDTRRLTDGAHRVSHLSWSPASDRLACFAEPKVAAHSAYNVGLRVINLATGAVSDALAGTDLSAEVGLYGDVPGPGLSAPIWSAGGQDITLLSQRGGGVDVLTVDTRSGEVRPIIEGAGHIARIALSPDGGRLYTVECDPSRPWEIARREHAVADMGQPRRLTHVNDEFLAGRAPVTPDYAPFRTYDDREIDGWLYRPAEAPAAGAPLVLWLHGGPDSAYGRSFYLLAQVFASRGYAVLHLNPRGSVGYGEAFTHAVDFDWGGGDARDVMAGLDATLARGGLDAERLAIMGASYGGYLTNWLIGQTGRFRAAVTINSVTNLLSCFGTADLDPVWAEGYYGWPWDEMDFYLERSPITHAHKVTTPTRIIAAERDYRCPISQSEEWFTWLKKRGHAPVDFVRLPGATHTTFASPRQRVRRMDLTLEWIEHWLSNERS